MAILTDSRKYRKDIDGLRAIAVLAVIIFHFGHLPNGYLGVDVFFVVSGYLITGIIYQEICKDRFSISNFYLRRTRRIIPLVLFLSLVSMIIGIIIMLPDDLENLAQSIIATNIFGNNILQIVTTKNYWNVVNEFKPLMHTWSLGIEEQYYLLYPFLFIIFSKKRIKWILPVLFVLTIISLILFFSPYKEFYKFYLLPFRFYELSIGGIAAITLKKKLINHKYSPLLIVLLLLILFFDFNFIPKGILLFLTIVITCGLIISSNEQNKLSSFFLENSAIVFIGKISFSLYMWHHILLAYARYFIFQEMNAQNLLIIFILTILLSAFTYYIIEQPFRNKNKVNNRTLLWSLSLMFLFTNSIAIYIYLHAGVLRDIPELNITTQNAVRNMHAKYNDKIYKLDNDFTSTSKTKILIIGNSFARDWANILLESKFQESIEISYIYKPGNQKNLKNRVDQADVIFYSLARRKQLIKLEIDEEKIWVIGTKNFGINNGLFFNYQGNDYCKQRTSIDQKFIESNKLLKEEWEDRYIDIIEMVIDKNLKVPVFTPDCKFISQDCKHLTISGAQYFASLIQDQPEFVLNKIININ